jgi:hypothetical protein
VRGEKRLPRPGRPFDHRDPPLGNTISPQPVDRRNRLERRWVDEPDAGRVIPELPSPIVEDLENPCFIDAGGGEVREVESEHGRAPATVGKREEGKEKRDGERREK